MATRDVALVRPDGKTQGVKLRVAKDGVSLLRSSGQVLETFPYTRILRWIPSEERSSNKGKPEQLDLQIHIPGSGK